MKLLFWLLALVSLASSELLDLSYQFDEDTIYWPGLQKFHFTEKLVDEETHGFFYSANDFALAEHGGTHIDAPYHFDEHGLTLDKIPLEKFFVKGVFVDASDLVKDNSSYLIGPDVFTRWVEKNGPLPDNSVVLVKTGWSKYYPKKELYMGPSDTEIHFPGISASAAQWLVDAGKVVGMGIDTASPDIPTDTTLPVHRILLAKSIYIIEMVNLSLELPSTFNLTVLPIKIAGGTGGPVRMIAQI